MIIPALLGETSSAAGFFFLAAIMMQLQIDCIEWVLEKIEVNKIPNDRLDSVIRKMIWK